MERTSRFKAINVEETRIVVDDEVIEGVSTPAIGSLSNPNTICNVMKSCDQSHDRSNLIGSISNHY